ncbi:hypothetical protein, partial [Ralstonia sp. TCR112]|uniref:hypothetical protein n=1 Tax=Ralstonia sp. TCR112 TaxID=2601730 RepID=UPI001C9BAF3F
EPELAQPPSTSRPTNAAETSVPRCHVFMSASRFKNALDNAHFCLIRSCIGAPSDSLDKARSNSVY